MRKGYLYLQPTTESLGERRELSQRGPGRSPGEKQIWCILSVAEHFCLQDMVRNAEL